MNVIFLCSHMRSHCNVQAVEKFPAAADLARLVRKLLGEDLALGEGVSQTESLTGSGAYPLACGGLSPEKSARHTVI